MADGPEPADSTSAALEKDEQRAEKARVKEQKRVDKEAARAQREAERARLDEETLGKQLGFRVFKDGTVEKEQASGSAWLQTKLDERGLGGLSRNPHPRSRLISATVIDNRRRRSFDKTRQVASVAGEFVTAASGGWLGGVGGGSDPGAVSLTIVTNDWTEKVSVADESKVAGLMALNGLLLHVTNGSASSGEVDGQRVVPPPPPPSSVPPPVLPPAAPASTPAIDVPVPAETPASVEMSAPAGWHPDPYGTARLRWWDGHAWSSHTAP